MAGSSSAVPPSSDALRQSEQKWRELVRVEPQRAEAHFNLGNALTRLGRASEAIQSYQRALELEPTLSAYNNLGKAQYAAREFGAACDSFRRAISASPREPHLYRNLGTAQSALGDRQAALESFERALRLAPNALNVLQSLATTAMECGQWQLGHDTCSAWLRQKPCNVEALGLQSIALEELGQHAAARELLDFERMVEVIDQAAPPAGFTTLSEFNQALARHALEHPTLHLPANDDPRYHCPTLRLTDEFCDDPAGAAGALQRLVATAVEGYLERLSDALPKHPFLVGAPRRFTLRSWATVLEEEGNLLPHVHYASYVSAVYYPKVPRLMSGGAHAGYFEFGGGPRNFPVQNMAPVHRIEPREGRLLLFPSYFYHRTAPFSASEPRISIAFDTEALG